MMYTILDTTISTTIFHFGNCSDSGHIIDLAVVAAEAFVLTLAEDNRAPNVFSIIKSNFYIHFHRQYQNTAAKYRKSVTTARQERSLHIISPVLATQDFNMTTAVPIVNQEKPEQIGS